MKKNLMAIALIGLMLCNTYKSFSQATTAGNANNPVGADYLGWANGNAIPLKIQNINAQPIEFYTGTGPTKYMTLLGSTNPGFLGIGIATPRSLVHLDAGSLQITNSTSLVLV